MTEQRDMDARERTIVGLDLHSVKVQLHVSRWRCGVETRDGARDICTTLADLGRTYRNNVPQDSLTVIEATGNAYATADRLVGMGYAVKIVKADTVSRFERTDHVNDRIDARNLARAEAVGLAREVYTPTKEYRDYRALLHKYRNATKAVTRMSNGIWAFCHAHGYALPPRRANRKVEEVRGLLRDAGMSACDRLLLQDDLDDYERMMGRRERLRRGIEGIVAGNAGMRRAMQILGVGPLVAFAVMAYVEDVGRFGRSAQLVAYFGLNPVCSESGKSASPRRLSPHGVRVVKPLLVEGAKTAMRFGDSAMHRWAKRRMAQGKPRNVVACAVARKSVSHLWHALKGHPAPSRDTQRSYHAKIVKLGGRIGPDALRALGHAGSRAFADAVVNPLYEHLPTDYPKGGPAPRRTDPSPPPAARAG